MKTLAKIVLILGVIVLVGFVAKNEIVRWAVKIGVKSTGLSAHMGRADVGIRKTHIGFYDFVLDNPSQYKDRTFAKFPKIFINYNLGDVIKGDAHLEEVDIDLAELVIVKNADGTLNFHDIKVLPAKGPQPKVRIDRFDLKLGKLIYKDYSRGAKPVVKEYQLNVEEHLTNVSGAQDLIGLLTSRMLLSVQRILIRSSISDVAGLGGVLGKQLGNVLGGALDLGKDITGAGKEGAVEIKNKIKGIFQ